MSEELDLERVLLLTGMMSPEFIDKIKSGEVDESYVQEAFQNFRKAQNPGPREVAVQYVLGIMFDKEEQNILVVLKNSPEFQAGKMNGLGGKIEEGETPIEAMEREFAEVSGVLAKRYPQADGKDPLYERPQWRLVGVRRQPALFDNQPSSYRMHIFACHFDPKACDSEFVPDEGCNFEIQRTESAEKRDELVKSVPLCLDSLVETGVPGFAGLVQISRDSLRENFLIDLVDPVDMAYLDDSTVGEQK